MMMANEQSAMPGQQPMQMQTPQRGGMSQPGMMPQAGMAAQPGMMAQPAMMAQPGMMAQPAMMAQPGTMAQPGMTPQPAMMQGGHLYMQTNEVQNCIIHYFRAPDGKLTELERVLTGGAGSGTFKPTSGEASAPNAFEGAYSIAITPDHRYLFTTNGGDNSVSSFEVGVDGKLVLLDAKKTGNINIVAGKSGTAKALQYSPAHKMLYVLHSFGPDHVRLMSVDDEGHLTPRPERYTANTMDKPNRIATMAALTPDEKFLIIGTTFDFPVAPNPDGTPDLWVDINGVRHSRASNSPDPDGVIVYPVASHGTLGEAKFQDGGGGSPWNFLFLRHRPNTFAVGYAVGDGVAIGKIDEDGNISVGPIANINTFGGKPTEICWLSATPDDRMVFSTAFGYGYLTSFHIEGNVLSVAKDPACPKVPGDGTWRALNGTVSSGPSDSWICPTGSFLYQIYGNAAKLIAYRIHPDGELEQISSTDIPYQSPQGLNGF